MFQLSPNHQDEIVRTAEVSFTFNGKSLLAHKGESLAAALMRAKLLHLSDSPADGAPRGVFCCMGLCVLFFTKLKYSSKFIFFLK